MIEKKITNKNQEKNIDYESIVWQLIVIYLLAICIFIPFLNL